MKCVPRKAWYRRNRETPDLSLLNKNTKKADNGHLHWYKKDRTKYSLKTLVNIAHSNSRLGHGSIGVRLGRCHIIQY